MRTPARPRVRLWMKLAAFAAAGVVAMHAVHLFIGNRVATRALAAEAARLGRDIGRLVAERAADPLLVNDLLALEELVHEAAAPESRVAYCLVVRDGVLVASSFEGPPPAGLVSLRPSGDAEPIVVRSGDRRVLDLAAPILGGRLGHVQLGLDMEVLDETRRTLAVRLGVLALALVALGLAAAFVAGRLIGRPVGEIVAAADRFHPGAGSPEVRARGSDEIAVLADRFNQMMRRLDAAHAEQSRARQKAVETERLAAMGSLVAGVAHEVNNPLAGLKNCVRRLERVDLPEAKRREYLALMDEGLVRIEEVVRQLLDFGRPHPPRLEPVAASLIAREAVALVRPALERRGVSLELVGDDVAPPASADRRLVEQGLLNLVLNAAYVTPDGGRIRMRLRAREGLVGISVEDEGPGIPPEIRDRVLDPFFSTKPEGEGTGLGLSVTRTIAHAHGGELTFEFPEGGGTVATLWVPAAAAAPRRASS